MSDKASAGIVSTATEIESAAADAVDRLNSMTREVFQTRGGRIGSGMGLLLEGLWGYHVNAVLRERHALIELAWLGEHQYNDFAVVRTKTDWDPTTKAGELLRIEAKSMIRAADESKAHFDALQNEIGSNDLLLVLVWDWTPTDSFRFSPKVIDTFIGNALELARFRDALHIARGGSFVVSGECPDNCSHNCSHVGEPLNASGKRERGTGPIKSRVSTKVSFAANFGGLTRMIAAAGKAGKENRDQLCKGLPTGKRYVDFIDKSVRLIRT